MSLFSAFIVKTFTSHAKSPGNSYELINSLEPYDVIIVPGVPYNDAYWSKVLMGRIYWSYYLYINGFAKNIIYSGSAVYTPYIESEVMKMYAKELGIPSHVIFTENKAEHSVENVYNSYHMAQELGFKKIALATDPFQTWMMKNPSKKLGLNIDFIPFSFDILEKMDIKEPTIDAKKAFVSDFESIENRENFIKRFRGTLGKNINTKE